MKISNLAQSVKHRKNPFSKAKGLMFTKYKDRADIFHFEEEKIEVLHMLFVFRPIDVLFLNKKKEIVEIKEFLGPFKFYKPEKKAKYIVELPSGRIKEKKLRQGMKIEFQP